MKRFKFSLQTLHEMRQEEREQAERALALATTELAQAMEAVETVIREIDKTIRDYAGKVSSGNVSPYEGETYSRYIASLDKKLEVARARQAEAAQLREHKIQELIKATTAAEATTRLREQHYQRYVAEVAREEQNLIDELATIASSRRLKGTQ